MDQLTRFLDQLLVSNPEGPSLLQVFLAMGVAYAGGVLSSFTPCVYPMIPITVGVIGGLSPHDHDPHGKTKRHWREILARIAAYLGGMVLVYSALGVAAGLTGKIFGSFTNTSLWYLILGLILTFSALAMTETIPFDPVAWFNSVAHRWRKGSRGLEHAQSTESLWGAAGLGASSGLISSPCTTPVLTVIIAFIAKSQSVIVGLSLMFGFSLGLGTLLVLISLFTGALQILPRSGKWMKTVKVVSGLLLLAFGEYLIYKAGTLKAP